MSDHKDAFLNLGDPNFTRTQELLAPFGFNATNKLVFDLYYETSGHYPQSALQAQVLKSSLEASGVVAVNLLGLDWPFFASARRSETMQAFMMGWYPDYTDPDDYVFPMLDSTGNSWLHINYADPQMDQLVSWAQGNTSSSIRSALYSQIQDLMVTDSPIVPLYQGLVFAVSRVGIREIYLDITPEFRYQLISFENMALDGKILKTVAGQGYGLNITIIVANQGNSIRSFNLTVYCNSTLIIFLTDITLAGEETRTFVLAWNASGFAYGNCTVWAEIPVFPEESDVADNNFTYPAPVHVGVPGDISGSSPGIYDGVVNMKDIAYMVGLFNTRPSSPNWRTNADINNDGICNMRDIAIAIYYFNQIE